MRIAILAVPYDDGRRSVGVGLGPARLIEGGLVAGLRAEAHDVREEIVELPNYPSPPQDPLTRILALQALLANAVRQATSAGEFPIVLAGNCSSAVGTLAARPADAAVVWFDAHGDFNTPATTITGKIDGMALAMAAGRAHGELTVDVPGFAPVEEHRVLLAGTRDLDPLERDAIDASGIQVVPPAEIATLGARISRFGSPTPPLYVHLDLDVLDPIQARANEYAPPGGLSPEALVAAIEQLTTTTTVYALAVTAYDPAFDANGRARRAALRAIHAAVPRDIDRE